MNPSYTGNNDAKIANGTLYVEAKRTPRAPPGTKTSRHHARTDAYQTITPGHGIVKRNHTNINGLQVLSNTTALTILNSKSSTGSSIPSTFVEENDVGESGDMYSDDFEEDEENNIKNEKVHFSLRFPATSEQQVQVQKKDNNNALPCKKTPKSNYNSYTNANARNVPIPTVPTRTKSKSIPVKKQENVALNEILSQLYNKWQVDNKKKGWKEIRLKYVHHQDDITGEKTQFTFGKYCSWLNKNGTQLYITVPPPGNIPIGTYKIVFHDPGSSNGKVISAYRPQKMNLQNKYNIYVTDDVGGIVRNPNGKCYHKHARFSLMDIFQFQKQHIQLKTKINLYSDNFNAPGCFQSIGTIEQVAYDDHLVIEVGVEIPPMTSVISPVSRRTPVKRNPLLAPPTNVSADTPPKSPPFVNPTFATFTNYTESRISKAQGQNVQSYLSNGSKYGRQSIHDDAMGATIHHSQKNNMK